MHLRVCNMTIKYIFVLFALLFIIGSTNAIDLREGVVATSTLSKVYLSDGVTTFENVNSDISGSTSILINDKIFIPSTKSEGDKIIWTTPGTGFLGLQPPVMKVEYSYTGNSLKETITLKEDVDLSFALSLGKDSKLIPWYNNQWKIVSASSGDTMNGIILEKPFGVDSNKNIVDMNYVYTGDVLNLKYNRILKIYNKTLTEKANEFDKDGFPIPKFSDVPIKYPMIIDPTWTSASGCWTANDEIYRIVMWNTTGTTTFSLDPGITQIEYLIVAGGGGGGSGRGGGGGAGGFRNGSINIISGSTYTIVVGDGGTAGAVSRGGYGGNSSFGNGTFSIVSDGGGGGATTDLGDNSMNGTYGGSGGGGVNTIDDHNPGGGTTGQGNRGGYGIKTAPNYGAGGGGGNSTTGYNGTSTAGGNGGSGGQSNITGTMEYYSGGGGGGAYITSGTPGTGGVGGGGNGAEGNTAGSVGVAATGGGGGGGGYGTISKSGGIGGSGIVIIRWLITVPVPSFDIVLTDTSRYGNSFKWNATNLTGDNVERTYGTASTLIMNAANGFCTGNYFINLTVSNGASSSSINKTIALNLTSPRVYFWNRTG